MDYAVHVVSAEIVSDVLSRSDVAVAGRETLTAIQHFGVVQGGAMIHRKQVVVALVGVSQGSDG